MLGGGIEVVPESQSDTALKIILFHFTWNRLYILQIGINDF